MDSSLNNQWKYEDPKPGDRGILLSNEIDRLCQQGLLISKDYDPKKLRPASYTLRIGDDFIDSDGKKRRMTDNEDSFVFKKNSIIFVSTKEEFDIPFYIIARFNIRVNWVYDGILLGTGPQVDPGFSGVLSCPLYNLTNVDITIRRGQDFATIDFEKTTSLLTGVSAGEREKIIDGAVDKKNSSVGGEIYSFYKVPPLKPLQHRKSHMIVSSLFEIKEEVRTWRSLGIGSVIAFFGLTLSLIGFGANLYRQNSDLNRQLVEFKTEIQQANERILDLEKNMGSRARAGGQGASDTAGSESKDHKKHP